MLSSHRSNIDSTDRGGVSNSRPVGAWIGAFNEALGVVHIATGGVPMDWAGGLQPKDIANAGAIAVRAGEY